MKKRFSTILFLLFSLSIWAQEDLNDYIKYQPTQPETTQIEKYGDFSPPNAFGEQPISLPLKIIEIGELSLPIIMNYTSSSGVRVEERESLLGLSWHLSILDNYIEVVVQGGAQDFFQNHDPLARFQEIEYRYQSENLDSLDVLNDQLKANALNTPIEKKDFIADKINYNFLGKTGAILKDDNGNLIDVTSSKNELLITQSAYNSYEIIDGFGNKYFFNRVVSYTIEGSSKAVRKRFYLTKIQLYKGQEINFIYSDGQDMGVTVSDTYNTNSTMVTRMFQESLEYAPQNMNISDFTPIIKQQSNSVIYAEANLLKEVVFPNGRVVFNYSTVNDLLNSIEIKNNEDSNIEEFIFDNSDFFRNNSGEAVASMLTSVTRRGRDGLNNLPLYEFIYDQTSIPTRGATKGDYWGYHNGKETEVPEFSYFYGGQEYDFLGDDRATNFNFTKAGILEEIIYPTGGRSKFHYEPNYYKTQEVITSPSQSTNKNLNLTAIGQNPSVSQYKPIDSTSFYIEHGSVSSAGGITVTYVASEFNQNSTQYPYYKIIDPNNTVYTRVFNRENERASGTFNITNLPTGWYKVMAYVGDASLNPNDPQPSIFGTASVELTLSWEEYAEGGVETYQDILVRGGGVRIKKIENFDSEISITPEVIRTFEYGNENLNGYGVGEFLGIPNQVYPVSSINADLEGERHVISHFLLNKTFEDIRFYGALSGGGVFSAEYNGSGIQLSSDPIFPISYKGHSIFYPKVTVYNSDDKNNLGYTENIYSRPSKIEVRDIMGDFSTSSAAHLELNKFSDLSGTHLLKEINFNNQHDTVALKEYTYQKELIGEVPRLLIKPSEYTLHYTGSPMLVTPAMMRRMSEKNIKHFYFKERLFYEKLTSTSSKNFFQNNIVEVSKGIDYVSNASFRIKSENSVNSDGKLYSKHYVFPDQVINSSILGYAPITATELGDYNDLAATSVHRINDPIQRELVTVKNNLVLSSEVNRTYYKDFNNKLLPSSIGTGKGNSSLSERIRFLEYDDQGNILNVQKTNGPSVFYLWGYNGQLLIAKIENLTSNELKTALGVQDLNEIDEKNLSSIDDLRMEFPKSIITTYNYEPLIGVIKITNPRGDSKSFQYDDFNRLELIKNSDGDIISENQYNLKGGSN